MSRPSTTTPTGCASTARRCCAFTQPRTSGSAATADTCRVTRSERIASSTSTPATTGRNAPPIRANCTGSELPRSTIRWALHRSPFPLSGFRQDTDRLPPPPPPLPPLPPPPPPPPAMLSSAASVKARYSAPESRCAHPRAPATAAAVEDLPEAAGPSIAMTRSTRRKPAQVREEAGVADRHRTALRQAHGGARKGAEHRKRHREPVITRRVHPTPRRAIRALHVEVVASRLCRDTHGPQVRGEQLQPVALFHSQLSDLTKHGLSHGPARQHGEHRHFIH